MFLEFKSFLCSRNLFIVFWIRFLFFLRYYCYYLRLSRFIGLSFIIYYSFIYFRILYFHNLPSSISLIQSFLYILIYRFHPSLQCHGLSRLTSITVTSRFLEVTSKSPRCDIPICHMVAHVRSHSTAPPHDAVAADTPFVVVVVANIVLPIHAFYFGYCYFT